MKRDYTLTRYSCYLGLVIQALVCNLTAVLFVPLMDLYGFSYVHLGSLVAINFVAQVAIDVIFSGLIDRVGYRKLVLPAVGCAIVGLTLFALSPVVLPGYEFWGMAVSTVVFAASSGLLEVMISPITNALPSESKGASMSLVHSFYAWGQVATVIVTTLLLFLLGKERWQWIALLWTLVPIAGFVMFALSPLPETDPHSVKRTENKKAMFHPFFLVALLAIFTGAATELTMTQWSSSFAEKILEMPKMLGDLLGMCGFGLLMALGRTFYGFKGQKLNLTKTLVITSFLACVCYLIVAFSGNTALVLLACGVTGLASSLLWPGTLVVSAERFPMAGAWMFALLAAAGDTGAAFGPWLTGVLADGLEATGLVGWLAGIYGIAPEQATLRLGLGIAAIFPLCAGLCHVVLHRMKKKQQ